MPSVRLFVYGSLKRDGQHHTELAEARFLTSARTSSGYALEPLSGYWALVAVPESPGSVAGELFEVETAALAALDAFEGPGYGRLEVALAPLHSSGFNSALAYFKKAR